MFGAQMGTDTEWLDPAGRRYRVLTAEPADTKHQQPAVLILDVGAPGVDESTTNFGVTLAGFPPSQTLLSYGSSIPGGLPIPSYSPFPALGILRKHLGLPVKDVPAVKVEHVAGRIELVVPFPSTPFGALNGSGVPPSVKTAAREAAAHGQVVITILGTITKSQAKQRGLFTIDPSKADQVERSLKPGVAPSRPRPAYWLGSSWNGQPASGATSTVVSSHASSQFGSNTYDVWYGHAGPLGVGAAGFGTGLDLETQDFPAPPRGVPANLFGNNGPFGGHGQRIHLADGTVAYFYYQMFNPQTKHNGIISGPGSSSTAPSKPTMPRGGFPPTIIVFTGRSQIMIQPAGALSRARALELAQALKRI